MVLETEEYTFLYFYQCQQYNDFSHFKFLYFRKFSNQRYECQRHSVFANDNIDTGQLSQKLFDHVTTDHEVDGCPST
jgi:hypothetical protein